MVDQRSVMALLPAKTHQPVPLATVQENDNAWVEQRNWTHVRKQVGYQHFDTTAELATLNALYTCLRLYKNFFQPALSCSRRSASAARFSVSMRPPSRPTSDCWRRATPSGVGQAIAKAV